MRRGLRPEDLGDLLDRPLAATISLLRPDGSIFSRPVWHRWENGRFTFEFPAGDRKIVMLERDPRITVLVAENEYPYRSIEVRGRVTMSTDGYHERGMAICRRYVEAYDRDAPVEAYLSPEPGMIAVVDADTTTCWDYTDEAMMPPDGTA